MSVTELSERGGITKENLSIPKEVHIAKQSPADLIGLGFVVLETSLLLLRMMNTNNYKKNMRFWMKRISQNADALTELLWREGERSNQLVIRKQNKEQLQLLRYKISRTIQTLFSFKKGDRAPFKMNQIHDYFGKRDWVRK